jgi:hypothetical protein
MISEVGAWQKIGCYLVLKGKERKTTNLLMIFEVRA